MLIIELFYCILPLQLWNRCVLLIMLNSFIWRSGSGIASLPFKRHQCYSLTSFWVIRKVCKGTEDWSCEQSFVWLSLRKGIKKIFAQTHFSGSTGRTPVCDCRRNGGMEVGKETSLLSARPVRTASWRRVFLSGWCPILPACLCM